MVKSISTPDRDTSFFPTRGTPLEDTLFEGEEPLNQGKLTRSASNPEPMRLSEIARLAMAQDVDPSMTLVPSHVRNSGSSSENEKDHHIETLMGRRSSDLRDLVDRATDGEPPVDLQDLGLLVDLDLKYGKEDAEGKGKEEKAGKEGKYPEENVFAKKEEKEENKVARELDPNAHASDGRGNVRYRRSSMRGSITMPAGVIPKTVTENDNEDTEESLIQIKDPGEQRGNTGSASWSRKLDPEAKSTHSNAGKDEGKDTEDHTDLDDRSSQTGARNSGFVTMVLNDDYMYSASK